MEDPIRFCTNFYYREVKTVSLCLQSKVVGFKNTQLFFCDRIPLMVISKGEFGLVTVKRFLFPKTVLHPEYN